MSITKKHFELLAAKLKQMKPQGVDSTTHAQRVMIHAQRVQWSLDCIAVAEACQQTNPRFDKQRFFAVCGFNEESA